MHLELNQKKKIIILIVAIIIVITVIIIVVVIQTQSSGTNPSGGGGKKSGGSTCSKKDCACSLMPHVHYQPVPGGKLCQNWDNTEDGPWCYIQNQNCTSCDGKNMTKGEDGYYFKLCTKE